jgi:hypothetical protein
MILLALFLVSSLLMGYFISKYFSFIENFIERSAFAVIVGLTVSTFFCFIVSFAIGTLGDNSLMASIVFNFMLLGAAIRKVGWKPKIGQIKLNKPSIWVILVVILFVIIAYFNFHSIYEDKDGNIWGIANSWADYALHIGIINSFALRDNFPPIYPNLAATPMRYPFMLDFLSAILVKEGIPITFAITVPNLLMLFSLVTFAFAFVRKFAFSEKIAAIAIILFFINGNMGLLQFVDDFNHSSDKGAFMEHLPKVYTHLEDTANNVGHMNIRFMNLTYSVFIPQRTALMGFSLVLLVFIILYKILEGKGEKLDYLLAGILTALLPMVHATSFGIAGLVAGIVFLVDIFRNQNKAGRWLIFAIPLIIIALPQLIFINEQPRVPGFFGPQVGWVSKAATYMQFVKFWWDNAGLTLALGLLGIFFLKRNQLLFLLPFAGIFIFANLIRMQPWDWDNIKILMFWYFALCILAAIFVSRAFDFLIDLKRWLKSLKIGKKMPLAPKIIAFFLGAMIASWVLLCIASGLLTFYAWAGSGAVMWSAKDIEMANWINANTEKTAVFLIAGKHNHIAYTLAGRQALAGYDGHLWSHGLDYFQQASATREIYASADVETAKKWGVNYIYLGPVEINEWGANLQLFEYNQNFKEVYFNSDTGVHIFRVE